MTMTGGCQCRAVRYRAEGEPLIQGFCHCRNCQRISGAGNIGFICFPEGSVVVEGATFAFSARDTFVVPSWQRYTLHAMEACTLFSYSDRPVQRALGIWREQQLQ